MRVVQCPTCKNTGIYPFFRLCPYCIRQMPETEEQKWNRDKIFAELNLLSTGSKPVGAASSRTGESSQPSGSAYTAASASRFSSQPQAAQQPAAEARPQAQTTGQSLSGERPTGQSLSGSRPAGQSLSGERPSGQSLSGGRPAGQSLSGGRPAGQSLSGAGTAQSGTSAASGTTGGEQSPEKQASELNSAGCKLYREKKYQQAYQNFKKAIDLRKDRIYFYNMANCLNAIMSSEKIDRMSEMVELLKESHEMHYSASSYRLGMIYDKGIKKPFTEKWKNDKEAIKYYRRVLRYPDTIPEKELYATVSNLGVLFADAKNMVAAAACSFLASGKEWTGGESEKGVCENRMRQLSEDVKTLIRQINSVEELEVFIGNHL